MGGRLVYVGHATVLVELDGVRVLTDPVLGNRILHLRRRVPPPTEPLEDLSAILISHVHYDHLDMRSLKSLGRDVPVIAPRGTRRVLRRFSDVRELQAYEETEIGGVTVRAVPAEHGGARLNLRSAPSLGYVIEGSRSVYFAGDTDLFAEMKGLSPGLDLALVPVAGWGSKVGAGHLDARRAAAAVRLLAPKLAVPIHWGTLSTPLKPASTQPAVDFQRLVAEQSPEVEVRVLAPGESLSL